MRGLRKTAPYFHNNSANTLEEVVDHYIEFFKLIGGSAARRRAAGRVNGRREFRSAAASGRASSVARLFTQAVVYG